MHGYVVSVSPCASEHWPQLSRAGTLVIGKLVVTTGNAYLLLMRSTTWHFNRGQSDDPHLDSGHNKVARINLLSGQRSSESVARGGYKGKMRPIDRLLHMFLPAMKISPRLQDRKLQVGKDGARKLQRDQRSPEKLASYLSARPVN